MGICVQLFNCTDQDSDHNRSRFYTTALSRPEALNDASESSAREHHALHRNGLDDNETKELSAQACCIHARTCGAIVTKRSGVRTRGYGHQL